MGNSNNKLEKKFSSLPPQVNLTEFLFNFATLKQGIWHYRSANVKPSRVGITLLRSETI